VKQSKVPEGMEGRGGFYEQTPSERGEKGAMHPAGSDGACGPLVPATVKGP